MDPPDHGRLRGLVQKVFTPKAFEDRAPAIQSFVDEHLERALAQDEVELALDKPLAQQVGAGNDRSQHQPALGQAAAHDVTAGV